MSSSVCPGPPGVDTTRPPIYKVIGIVLAISSGFLIGTSFVFKKVGLLKANVKYHEEAGEGYGYLKNAWWWTGMTLMILGEICNFVAYAFVEAILVTPMGALSVVVTTILSAIFLKERLSFVGKVGCFMCIVGSTVIALNAPEQPSANTIQQMQCYVISPGFLTYAGVICIGSIFIALWAGPRYGKKSMLVYLSVCSLVGGLSVVATQGLGAAILTQASGVNQFNQWFLYILFVFVVITLLTEIVYLNKALNLFNAALVTPTYYVYFTSSTIVASAILFRGFNGTPVQIITLVLGFFTICAGVVLLQLSKSSKDVPDAAVFSGDLDQVRTVAEQEEQESEPKADAIRGTAALIRSLSKTRQRRETAEAKRIHEERLEPIGEDESVEWDGIRRRKTVRSNNNGSNPTLGSTGSSTGFPNRTKTVHYPLGMSHFPNENEGRDVHDGILARVFSSKRNKNPKRHTSEGTNRSISFGSTTMTNQDEADRESMLKMPVQLSEISRVGTSSTYGRSDSPPPPMPPPHSSSSIKDGKRTFSFHNIMNRSARSSSQAGAQPFGGMPRTDSPSTLNDRPNTATSGKSSMFSSIRRGGGSGSGTEEERLGLVVGDSATRNRGSRITEAAEEEEAEEREEYERRLDDDDEVDAAIGGYDGAGYRSGYFPSRGGMGGYRDEPSYLNSGGGGGFLSPPGQYPDRPKAEREKSTGEITQILQDYDDLSRLSGASNSRSGSASARGEGSGTEGYEFVDRRSGGAESGRGSGTGPGAGKDGLHFI